MGHNEAATDLSDSEIPGRLTLDIEFTEDV